MKNKTGITKLKAFNKKYQKPRQYNGGNYINGMLLI